MWHHGMYGGGFGFGFMFLHLLGNLFFLALLIGAIMFFVRGARFAGGRGPGNWGGWSRSMRGTAWMNNFAARDGALEVARTRLAKSEITPEQFKSCAKDSRHAPEKIRPEKQNNTTSPVFHGGATMRSRRPGCDLPPVRSPVSSSRSFAQSSSVKG